MSEIVSLDLITGESVEIDSVTETITLTVGAGEVGPRGPVGIAAATLPLELVDHTVSILPADTDSSGSMSALDKVKLDGVAAGATANATDAQLRARVSHTGTQTLETISDAGGAAALDVGTTAGTVAAGDDPRLTDERVPADGSVTLAKLDFDPATQTELNTEATTRAAADSALQTNITAEATARTGAATTLQTNITNEASARASADTTLQTNLAAEASARAVADALKVDLTDVRLTNTRTPTDNTVSTAKIQNGAVTPAKLSFDPATQVELDAEATTRAAADASLQTNITDHAADTTSVHGITDTALLATKAYADSTAATAAAALVDAAPTTLNTLNELAAALGDDPNFATTITAALGGKQPLDSDLTAIAALSTTTFGRALLALADASAARTALGLGTAATAASTAFEPAGAVATHSADTTNVHGIADTAELATQTDISSATALMLPLAGGTMSGAIASIRASAADLVLSARVAGDTNSRLSLLAEGRFTWGFGSSEAYMQFLDEDPLWGGPALNFGVFGLAGNDLGLRLAFDPPALIPGDANNGYIGTQDYPWDKGFVANELNIGRAADSGWALQIGRNSPQIVFGDPDVGSSEDTNLYRSAAATLKTDGSFVADRVVAVLDGGTP